MYEVGFATVAAAIWAQTAVATGSPIGLGRPANTPVATTSIVPQAVDSGDAAAVSAFDTAWSTAPTAPTVFLRRGRPGAGVGNAAIWVWSDRAPLILAVSSWLVLWNPGGAAGAILEGYLRYEE